MKIFMATFGAVLLAELADKTQLVGFTMSSRTQKPWIVFMGSVLAYSVITLVTVLVGSMVGQYIKPDVVRFTAGGLFVILGLLIVWGKI